MEDTNIMELRCPKCSYLLQPETGYDPPKECPRCGIIYEKYEAYRSQAKTETERAERATTQVRLELKKAANRILKPYLFIKKLFLSLLYQIRQNKTLTLLLSRYKNSLLIQWIIWHKDTISSILFKLWIVGFGYWIYRLITADTTSQGYWSLINTAAMDSREALTYLFFGSIICFFLLILSAFIIKFMYNLIWEGIKSRFSDEWHPLLTSVALLVLLYIALPATEKIKLVGLSAYYQIVEIAHTAKQYEVILETKPKKLPGLNID